LNLKYVDGPHSNLAFNCNLRHYNLAEINSIEPAHRPPRGVRDWLAYGAVQFARRSFDGLTGYAPGKKLTINNWLQVSA